MKCAFSCLLFLCLIYDSFAFAQGETVLPRGTVSCPHSGVDDSNPMTFSYPISVEWDPNFESPGSGIRPGPTCVVRFEQNPRNQSGDLVTRYSRPSSQAAYLLTYSQPNRMPVNLVPCFSGESGLLGAGQVGNTAPASERSCTRLRVAVGRKREQWQNLLNAIQPARRVAPPPVAPIDPAAAAEAQY